MKISLVLGSLILLFVSSCSTYEEGEARPSGWQSPKLSAPAQTGKMVDLQYALSGPWAAVFFYPVADTPW